MKCINMYDIWIGEPDIALLSVQGLILPLSRSI